MRIGNAKAVDRQSLIFDPEYLLTSGGAARSWVGDFFEAMLAGLTGAVRIKTDSRADICPDLQLCALRFLECKAVGQSGQGIIYKCRWEKDARFIAEGKQIFYCFWRHGFPAMSAKTINELRAGLAGSIAGLAIVRRQTLQTILDRREVRPINSQYQKTKSQAYAKYGEGWVFPAAEVFRECSPVGGRYAEAYGERAFVRIAADDPFETGDLINWG